MSDLSLIYSVMEYEYKDLFARNRLLLGEAVMSEIARKKIILFGVGGVGSWCAEALIRSGYTELTLVDSDRVAPSNINRQLQATTRTIGLPKVEVLKERLLQINPHANIQAIAKIYSEETSEEFQLDRFDYILDAIDSLKHKAHLFLAASKTAATVFSSMGAALKIDPQRIKVAEFHKVRGCKLAAALRGRFKQEGISAKEIVCVYSEERRENLGAASASNTDENGSFRKAQTNGTMVHITAIFGFTLSGLVIQDTIQKAQ